MKCTAVAPANIAFIKYWGRTDATLRLPANPSVSMNLSASTTTTTVEFSNGYSEDSIELLETGGFSAKENRRVIRQLDIVREYAGVNTRARIVTKNTFPKSSGAASSASGFAALTMAAASALGLTLPEKELTMMARLGSGSACRSIPDGFVKWEGEAAYSLYPHAYWDLRDILVIVENRAKDVSSSAGHDTAGTSPYFPERLKRIPDRLARLERALAEKNFRAFGEVTEEDCLDMHRVMQTQTPPLFYWNDATRTLMEAVRVWRSTGIPVYFTIDAGPNVHLLCEGNNEGRVREALSTMVGIADVIVNAPAEGAHIVTDHLF